jgi:Ty3 transposon capsid-like protein
MSSRRIISGRWLRPKINSRAEQDPDLGYEADNPNPDREIESEQKSMNVNENVAGPVEQEPEEETEVNTNEDMEDLRPIKIRPIEAKPVTPPTFEGISRGNIDIWLFEVEQYFELVELPAKQKVTWAGSLLRESAASWWRSVVMEAKKSQPEALTTDLFSWLDFKNLIRKRFQPVEASKTARSRMMALKQFKFGANGIEAYNAEFQKLVALTTDMALQDQLTYYLKGLQPRVAHDVSLGNPDTLDAAMALASRSNDLYSNFTGSSGWNRGSNNHRLGVNGGRYFSPRHQENYSSSPSGANVNALTSLNAITTQGSRNPSRQLQSPNSRNYEGNFQMEEELNFMNKSVPIGSEGFKPNSYLSEEEWKKCRQENRCFRCKKVGHRASACRTRPRTEDYYSRSSQSNSSPQSIPLNLQARR